MSLVCEAENLLLVIRDQFNNLIDNSAEQLKNSLKTNKLSLQKKQTWQPTRKMLIFFPTHFKTIFFIKHFKSFFFRSEIAIGAFADGLMGPEKVFGNSN